MTHKNNYTLIEDLSKQGLDAIPELVRILINNAMCLQREEHLKARSYERTPQRQGYANGYKPKTVKTNMGEITFDIPQVRDSDFYPTALAKVSVSFTAKRWSLCAQKSDEKRSSSRQGKSRGVLAMGY